MQHENKCIHNEKCKLALLDADKLITVKTSSDLNDDNDNCNDNCNDKINEQQQLNTASSSEESKHNCDEEYVYYLKVMLTMDDNNNIKFIKLSKTLFDVFNNNNKLSKAPFGNFNSDDDDDDDDDDDNNEISLILSYSFSYNMFEVFKRYFKDKSIHLKIHKTKHEFRITDKLTLEEFMEFIVTNCSNMHFVQFSKQLFSIIFNANVTNHKDDNFALYNNNLLVLVRDYIAKKKKSSEELIETENSICNKIDNSYEYKDEYKKYEKSPELDELTKIVNKPRETVEDILNSEEFKEKYAKLISEGKSVASIYEVMNNNENITSNENITNNETSTLSDQCELTLLCADGLITVKTLSELKDVCKLKEGPKVITIINDNYNK